MQNTPRRELDSELVSVIVPTNNRPQYLARLLKYYQDCRLSHAIVVADGSTGAALRENQKLVVSHHGTLHIYHQCYRSNAHSSRGLYQRITKALRATDSKYAVICADDDFIVPNALDQCAKFLDAHPDYSIAHGHLLGFYPVYFRGLSARPALWTHLATPSTIDHPDPDHRLRQHLLNYKPTFYSVHRRADLSRNMNFTARLTKDYGFAEMLPSCLSLVQGKMKFLDILHGVRTSNPKSTSSVEDSWRWHNLLTLDDYSTRYMHFRNCIAQELSSTSPMPLAAAKKAVDDAFREHLAIYMREADALLSQPRPNTVDKEPRGLSRAFLALRAAARIGLAKGRVGDLLRSPREVVTRAYYEDRLLDRGGFTPVEKLLNSQSPFHEDFQPIYDSVVRYPGLPQ